MKNVTKVLLITAALVTASGVAIGARGVNCDGQGPFGYGPAKHQMQGKHGQGRAMRGGHGIIYQLDNLSAEQKQEISALRQQMQAQKFAMREQMWQQRAEMKNKIDAILTADQREQLSQLRPRH